MNASPATIARHVAPRPVAPRPALVADRIDPAIAAQLAALAVVDTDALTHAAFDSLMASV